jgi:hypothetical protein
MSVSDQIHYINYIESLASILLQVGAKECEIMHTKSDSTDLTEFTGRDFSRAMIKV